MQGIFSIFRGDTKQHFEDTSYKIFLQTDSRMKDGFVWETNDTLFIELGINYSNADIPDKIKAITDRNENALRKTIDGEVCQILISKIEKKVTIVTDPYGLLPLYYHKSKSEFFLSSDLKGVLLLKPELRSSLDYKSIMEYLAMHSIMANRTLFEGVQLIPEGSIVQFSIDQLDDWETCDWYTLPKSQEEKPLDEWIDEVSRELQKAVIKRARPGLGAFLSGGMDSRVILASIPEEIRGTMKALTFGVAGSDDLKIAEKVACRFGVEWMHVILKPEHFLNDALKHLWISDGASNHMVSLILDAVRQLGVDSIFDGTPGDANFGGGYASNLEELFDGEWPDVPNKYILKWLQKKGIARKLVDVNRLLLDTTLEKLESSISDGIETELNRLPEDMTPICQMENALYRIRVRRNTMGGQYSIDSISASLKPYFDVDLHETFLRIPARERRNHYFFNQFVRSAMPETLRDPTSRALPLESSDRIKRKVTRYIRAVARRFGLRILEPSPWLNTSKLMTNQLDYRNWLFDILKDERTRKRGLLNIETAIEMLETHVPGIIDYSILLVNVIDLELVLRLFADGEGFSLFGLSE